MLDRNAFVFIKLESNVPIEPFDCGEADLNAFLYDDAKNYYDDFMGVTNIKNT
jgi:hypothetical protein